MTEPSGHTATATPLLETKLFAPRWRTGLVERRRLIERLERGVESRLTLISAPAGFGKTTLLAEWMASNSNASRSVAWVSLDRSDNDPSRFWSYFIAALGRVYPGIGESTLAVMQLPQPPGVEMIVGSLLNEIVSASMAGAGESGNPPGDFAVVLDDFHLIDAKPIHDGVEFLVSNLPQQMHLVIASRTEPPLSLSRLRGRGELTELGASEMRFTANEAAAFLNGVMGLDLAADDVAALETRTEGWVAGLQLAALSMQGRSDAAGFIRAFAGNDRYVVDYLVEEVLQRQSGRIREFLLQTSILDRLSGPLCDAVTGQEGSTGLLEALERANLFLVPLDDTREWYRYHHLFADVLQQRLAEEMPGEVQDLHRRASDWCDRNGLQAEAIRHALAGEDYERAAQFIELAWDAFNETNEDSAWLGWAKSLPLELVRARPMLSAAFGWTLLVMGDIDQGEARIRDAEQWLDADEHPDLPGVAMVVASKEGLSRLPSTIALARCFKSQLIGDIPGTRRYAQQALDLLPEERLFDKAVALGLMGLAALTEGELEAAFQGIYGGMLAIRKTGNVMVSLSGTGIMAEIRVAQGRLRDAIALNDESIKLALGHSDQVLRGIADLYGALADLCIERGDLDAARENLRKAEEPGDAAASESYQYQSRVIKARLSEAEGDLESAHAYLEDAERVYTHSVVPDVRPVAMLKARVRLAQDRLSDAVEWARSRDLSSDDELSFLGEAEHITLAMVLIARYREEGDERLFADAIKLLDRLLVAAEEGERGGSVIEILVQQAIAHEARRDTEAALTSLERAVILAEPEGYAFLFARGGGAVRGLLRSLVSAGSGGPYARELLSKLEGSRRNAKTGTARPAQSIEEPLTPREIEILRLIASGMRNQDIADHLFISLSTVKRHIANMYGKLGASHRTGAVARADELNLL